MNWNLFLRGGGNQINIENVNFSFKGNLDLLWNENDIAVSKTFTLNINDSHPHPLSSFFITKWILKSYS